MSNVTEYDFRKDGIFDGNDDDASQLTNFTAKVTEQLRRHDSGTTDVTLTVVGRHEGQQLPKVTINATDFYSMSWVQAKWGIEPMIYNPQSTRDVAMAIIAASTPKTKDIYRHTGWAKVGKQNVYLHAGGAISSEGNNAAITVELPDDLQHFRFKPHENKEEVRRAVINSLNLGWISTQAHVGWVCLLAAYRSAIGKADFAIHLSGRTGTFKTETASLFQSHFGAELDARNVPASWSSTGNSLLAITHYAKNAICLIDDYVPKGTSYDVRKLESKADDVIRAQGNQKGRQRLSDRSNMQQTMFPRGIILSTGEDVYRGHSIRGRTMILELAPKAVTSEKLTKAQNNRKTFQLAMLDWIQWLAKNPKKYFEEHQDMARIIRDEHRDIGHTRTPQMIGDLIATAHLIKAWLRERDHVTPKVQDQVVKAAIENVMHAAEHQKAFLEESDPVDTFFTCIRETLAAGHAHIAMKNGTPPEPPQEWGWESDQRSSTVRRWKPNGTKLGWIDWEANEILIDCNMVKFLAKFAQGKLSITNQTLLKRLGESGRLARTDTARKRNTVRSTCEGRQRTCIAISMSSIQDSE